MNRIMKIAHAIAAVVVGATLAAPAFANADLAKSKNCMNCHGIDKRLVPNGPFPSYKEVAAKYAGKKDAEAMLAKKIITGGKGSFGEMVMPPNNVTEAEAKTLAKWVLSIK